MRSEIGSIFILVLMLLIAISLLSVHLMIQGILTNKLSARFQAQLSARISVENRLLEEELRIKKDLAAYSNNRIAFVPDELSFGCQEGMEIYKITMPPLQSFMAVRNP